MVSSTTGWIGRVLATFACLLLVLAGAQTASAADTTSPVDSSSTSTSEPGATLESAPVVSPEGAATASDALIDFVHAVLASTGFAAPDLLACVCTVAVSVGVGGDAYAVAVGGTAGGTDAALRSGDSGPAMAVSVSADGPAEAAAASGNTGQTGGGDPPGRAAPVTAPRGVTSAGQARVPQDKLDDAVRALVNALLQAARERSASDLGEYDDDLAAEVDAGLAEASSATIAVDLEVWSPTNGLRRDGGGCTPDADGVTVICAIALAISLGGTADADAQPPVGASGSGTLDGPGVVPAPGAGWPGDAIAIALSMNAAAAASADAGDAWIAAAYDSGCSSRRDRLNRHDRLGRLGRAHRLRHRRVPGPQRGLRSHRRRRRVTLRRRPARPRVAAPAARPPRAAPRATPVTAWRWRWDASARTPPPCPATPAT